MKPGECENKQPKLHPLFDKILTDFYNAPLVKCHECDRPLDPEQVETHDDKQFCSDSCIYEYERELQGK